MDTKLKNNKARIISRIIIGVFLILTSVMMVSAFQYVGNKIVTNSELEYDSYSASRVIQKLSYALYMDLAAERAGQELSAMEVYAPEFNLAEYEERIQKENQAYKDYYEADDFPDFVNWKSREFQSVLRDNFNVRYVVIDDTNNTVVRKHDEEFYRAYTENTLDVAKYPFIMTLSFDSNGNPNVNVTNGAQEDTLKYYFSENLTSLLYDSYPNYIEESSPYYIEFDNPKNMTIVFAAPKIMESGDLYYYAVEDRNPLFMGRYSVIALFAILVNMIFATLFFVIKPLDIGNGVTSKIPIEINIAGVFLIFGMFYFSIEMYRSLFDGEGLGKNLSEVFYIKLDDSFDWIFQVILWILILGLVWIVTISVLSLFRKGLRRYCRENILVFRPFYALKRWCKHIYKGIVSYDLSEKSNRIVVRIVGLNFIILLLMCSIWMWGIPILILYSILLFFLLNHLLGDLRKKYSILLQSMNQMAEGNLEVLIEEDLGVFEPMKEEMSKVQYGFKKAVEEEVKSQNMKAELITNVSHDLKTPLTAIITYIDLLKNENITEEDRTSYIQTIEQKSLRLKQLIEDLFEVSKAASKNIELNVTEVDLVSLIKQVQYEYTEAFQEAKIELREQLPEEKVLLPLDGQKTYRIFDNLFSNIIKYGLEHTRAYVEMVTTSEEVIITTKNISSTELDFDTDQITERFVRGDKARSSEGSGLGLAIVKSFVELQGGEFTIVVDGDLFKAIIKFRRIILDQ